MTIYLDLVFIINIFFDFLLLTATKYILKEHPKLIRMIISSIIGGFSILFLFLKINSLELFILKIIISLIMILVAFGKNNFIKVYINFYIISIFLGGSMYFLNYTFSSKHRGLIFFSNGLSINFIVMLLITPLILYFYIKEYKKYKISDTNCYKLTLKINDKEYNLKGYLDTGNTLIDPYKKRGIVLLNLEKQKINTSNLNKIYVPYKTISNTGVIPCYKVDRITIKDKVYKNLLIGDIKNELKIENSDCILPNKIKEDLI